jgi:hypothetical protein
MAPFVEVVLSIIYALSIAFFALSFVVALLNCFGILPITIVFKEITISFKASAFICPSSRYLHQLKSVFQNDIERFDNGLLLDSELLICSAMMRPSCSQETSSYASTLMTHFSSGAYISSNKACLT